MHTISILEPCTVVREYGVCYCKKEEYNNLIVIFVNGGLNYRYSFYASAYFVTNSYVSFLAESHMLAIFENKNILNSLNWNKMNVTDPELVLVRGINSDWFKENFSQFWIGFGGTPQATPKEDAYYVGLYMESPISAITHIGIVDRIERYDNGADFYLNAIIKLKEAIDPGHTIRKHENWSLDRLKFNKDQKDQMDNLRKQLSQL